MISGNVYRLALIVLGILLAFFLAVYMMMQFTSQRYQGSLQMVTKSSIYYARDDSARAETKVFVINRDEFENTVKSSDITDIVKGSSLKFQYVHDTSANATALNLKDPDIAIKAVRVIVTDGKNDHTDRVMTYIINSDSKTRTDDVTQ